MTEETEPKTRLVILGNGMASGRLLDEILARTPDKFAITVIGDEPEGSYNRIMLSPVLAGETDRQSIIHKDPRWYADNGIEFIAGKRGLKALTDRNQLLLNDDTCIAYDQLVFATGSRPARIPAENQQLANIFSFRTLADVDTINHAVVGAHSALVVGGGLLGLEAAYGLAQKGLKVTLVHRSPWPLNRQLDENAGKMLKQVMEAKGVSFQLATEVETFIGEGTVNSARLSNGNCIACDLAVIATGISPNLEPGEASGLACERGIQVNATMQTSVANISALGECCQFEKATFGLVEPIWQQCVSLADRLCLNQTNAFVIGSVATKLKVSGVQLYSAGEHLTQPEHREITFTDSANTIYRKLLLRDNKICGLVLFGDTRDGNRYYQALCEQQELPPSLASITLGESFQPLGDSHLTQKAVVNQ